MSTNHTTATPTEAATQQQPHANKRTPLDATTKRRIIIASTIGTTIEFYDFYAYATAAVAVFPFLFFPKNEDPTVGLLASFATFGLAFLGRPLGSVMFGHFGDRIGRKATLVGSCSPWVSPPSSSAACRPTAPSASPPPPYWL